MAYLRANTGEPMFDGRAVPLFVGIDCHGSPQCSTAAMGASGESGTYWVVLYPDCTGPDGDIGWMLLDGVRGVDGGGAENNPCPRHQ